MATTSIGGADFELTWPRDLFAQEVDAVLGLPYRDWQGRCELLLIDAFAGSTPVDLFRARGEAPAFEVPTQTSARQSQEQFIRVLARQSNQLREVTTRAPYWTERHTGLGRRTITLVTVARQFVQLVTDLEGRGYFEQAFDKDCVDDPSDVNPSSVIELQLGVAELWPLSHGRLAEEEATLFGVIEVLHDLVSRPRYRHFHSWSGCGWHHSEFALEPGRMLYRWRVNKLLERSDLGLRLADAGEDVGRLVAVSDDSRTDLARAMVAREDDATGDRIRHALALFRGRGATEHDKRSAVVALALVLEERRQLLKDNLSRKDERALFEIANSFAIRHQRADQQPDYDPVFLDWVFWWYLATIELTDRILDRSLKSGLA